MSFLHNLYNKYYFKLKMILAFSLLTVSLILVISIVSYSFIKGLYLDQLSEQVSVTSRLISNRIDKKYLDLLSYGLPVKTARDYFRSLFTSMPGPAGENKAFIFDNDFNILVHSDTSIAPGSQDTKLFLSQKEIQELKPGQSVASLPFKGDDGKWYLWGFCRLDESSCLAVRESAGRLEKVEDFKSFFWVIGVTGIILTIVLGWILARSVSRPVDVLVEFSKKIGQGNLFEPLSTKMQGEFGILSSSMDKMRLDLLRTQKEKENMLAQIAHEIRNPLGGIELLASLVKEDQLKEGKETVYLDKILKEVNGLKSLITAYLNYSRPAPAAPAWIDPGNILCDIENIFKSKLIEKKINLTVNNNLTLIYFDPSHLRNILVNLAANAIESISSEGKISISAAEEKGKWKISIADNGIGIAQKHMAAIFEPFFSTKKEGTGLGLAISKKLCEENSALLTAESNEKGGSVFSVIKNKNEN